MLLPAANQTLLRCHRASLERPCCELPELLAPQTVSSSAFPCLQPLSSTHQIVPQHFSFAHQESDIEYSIGFWVGLNEGTSKVLCHLVLNHVEPFEIFLEKQTPIGVRGRLVSIKWMNFRREKTPDGVSPHLVLGNFVAN